MRLLAVVGIASASLNVASVEVVAQVAEISAATAGSGIVGAVKVGIRVRCWHAHPHPHPAALLATLCTTLTTSSLKDLHPIILGLAA